MRPPKTTMAASMMRNALIRSVLIKIQNTKSPSKKIQSLYNGKAPSWNFIIDALFYNLKELIFQVGLGGMTIAPMYFESSPETKIAFFLLQRFVHGMSIL